MNSTINFYGKLHILHTVRTRNRYSVYLYFIPTYIHDLLKLFSSSGDGLPYEQKQTTSNQPHV